MINHKLPQQMMGMILVLLLTVGLGCNLTSTSAPTQQPGTPTTQSAQPTAQSGQPSQQPGKPTGQPGLFKFIQTVNVTPDSTYLTGAFSRINYVPATDRFVVTFGGEVAQPAGGCQGKVFSYKEYTTDMKETGKNGTFSCDIADAGSVMVDNTYYFAAMTRQGEKVGWHMLKIDVTSWKTLVDTFFPIDYPKEGEADPMVAYVNGQVDVSSAYSTSGKPPDPSTPVGSYGTHHQLFSTDLQFLGKKILTDPPHINGSYMVFVEGVYYLVTANLYDGDVLVAKYDKDWNYLGGKTLIKQAHFSTGLVYDGQRFYLAYTDTSQRTQPGFFPVSLNIHLAAFDRDWNLVEDVAVTSFKRSDNRQPGRPWVILHDNRLYVSYDVDTIDPATQQEQTKWQAYVSVYELSTQSGQLAEPTVQLTQPTVQSAQPTGQTGTCTGSDISPIYVLRSTDHGATWTSLGNACIKGLAHIAPADPTPAMINGNIALYFIDLNSLGQSSVPHTLYRVTTTDGVNFDTPQPAYTQTHAMVDPFVLKMADGSFRLYTPSDQDGIISAVSSDGLNFKREEGTRPNGGMPGALITPDGKVRLFLAGDGIASFFSNDGLTFTQEPGVRIASPANSITDNPEPIRLADGTYLMLYQIHEKKYEGQDPWLHTEIHLATSTDGFNWTANPTVIGYGGTSCVVEAPDGTLYIYYGGPAK